MSRDSDGCWTATKLLGDANVPRGKVLWMLVLMLVLTLILMLVLMPYSVMLPVRCHDAACKVSWMLPDPALGERDLAASGGVPVKTQATHGPVHNTHGPVHITYGSVRATHGLVSNIHGLVWIVHGAGSRAWTSAWTTLVHAPPSKTA